MKLGLLHKFNHWSEVLSVLTYADRNIPFIRSKRLKSGEEPYKDPLGVKYEILTPKEAGECALVVNGSIHLETHPLSKGKIPYPSLPYKIAIEHTTGYSPWDFLQMVDLAGISESKTEDAKGSKVLYAMNQKCYQRFMTTDWDACNKDYYEEYKDKIDYLVYKGYIVPTSIEPAQFWLNNVPCTVKEVSDNICLCLNWCNLNKVVKVQKIVSICEQLHNYTDKNIDIRLHSYSRESLFHILKELPYVNLIPYETMSKYEIMDKYKLYFVDGTGLGYEIAYRSKIQGRDINIFYLSDLSSDQPFGGFDGIVQMGAVPQYDQNDFVKGQDLSNFSSSIIEESFPHARYGVAEDCYNILIELSEKIKELN